MKHFRPAFGLPLVALLAACSGGDGPTKPVAPVTCSVAASLSVAPARLPETSPYDALFAAAGAEFGVPVALLRGVSWVEARWQMVVGEEEFPGMPPAYGLMALRGERLRAGARAIGLDESQVRRDPAANVRAAAALLRKYGDALGIARDDARAWAPVVARYSGIALAEGKADYVRDVEAARDGRRAPSASDVVARTASEPCAPVTPTAPTPATLTDQAGAMWRGSPNFNARMDGEGGKVRMVIIHSCEGGYSGCWSWLADPGSNVSAHYVVREDGAEITQLVRESARAWHIGATYDPSLNGGVQAVLQGVQSNHFTVGVEHGGYASQTTWPAAQIDASAQLVCDVTKRWQIPRDRFHIVSHGQLQPYNRSDPGRNWPWTEYLAKVNALCT